MDDFLSPLIAVNNIMAIMSVVLRLFNGPLLGNLSINRRVENYLAFD